VTGNPAYTVFVDKTASGTGRPEAVLSGSKKRLAVVLLVLWFPALCETHDAHSGNDEARRQAQPWLALKNALTSSNGADYFKTNLQDAEVPGGANGLAFLKGTVLSSEPSDQPETLVLAMSDKTTQEVTLRLHPPFDHTLTAGTEFEFSGIAKSFTSDPFMLTFDLLRFRISPRE
jgi:hypothetical protein